MPALAASISAAAFLSPWDAVSNNNRRWVLSFPFLSLLAAFPEALICLSSLLARSRNLWECRRSPVSPSPSPHQQILRSVVPETVRGSGSSRSKAVAEYFGAVSKTFLGWTKILTRHRSGSERGDLYSILSYEPHTRVRLDRANLAVKDRGMRSNKSR